MKEPLAPEQLPAEGRNSTGGKRGRGTARLGKRAFWPLAGVALLAVAALLYRMSSRPPAWVAVDGVPPAALESAPAVLAAAGCPPLEQPAWTGSVPAWRAPGAYRLFFAAGSGEGRDVYSARLEVDAAGALLAQGCELLTHTPAGEESAPVAAGGWLAYATQAAGRYQSVTYLPLSDLTKAYVFEFDRPVEQVRLAWRPAGQGYLLSVAASDPSGDLRATIDPSAQQVEPAGAGLTYVPQVQGEFAWLPNLVSRIRELPGVGPEKIAFVENVFFTAEDRVMRLLYGSPVPTPEPALVAEASPVPPPLPPIAPTALPELSTTAPAITAVPTQPAPTPATPQPSPAPAVRAPATPTTLPSATTLPKATYVPVPAGPTGGASGARPLAEGLEWRTTLRPDTQRPYAFAEVVDIDPRLLQIKMVPGTWEPRPTTGLVGSGVIPAEEWPALVAGFNGGFAAMHGQYGMMVQRKVYLPPRDGIATLAVYEDGSIRLGTWGKDLQQTPDMVSFRQNCPPLIENGTITAETGKLTLWGLSVSNEVYLYRSGLGVTADGRLVYVAGKPLSAYTLAKALQAAGAVYAMQLDVDEFHVAFMTYEKRSTGGAPGARKLRDDMRGFDGAFLRPFQLDFFYLVRRPQPLAQAVRQASGGPAPVPPAARYDLPGNIAFATNRDGNWELYAMKAGQPDSARRLTEQPADDVDPAWSPDGKQLAFSSRRDGNAEIYILDLAGGTRRVTQKPSEEWAPAWSPDGKRLLFQSDANGQSDIEVSALDGSQERRLTPYQGNHESPHWSPDGRSIVFDSDLDVSEAVHASINVYIMNADGSYPRRIYSHGESPAWSPDGRTVAFAAQRMGHWQILLMNVDGSNVRALAGGTYDARHPAWSPDGAWLAFAGHQEGHWEIYAVRASGGEPLRLTYGLADSSQPAWGP